MQKLPITVRVFLCNLPSEKAKNVQNTQKKQEMHTYARYLARNVEKQNLFLTNIYGVEGQKCPEQYH